MIRDRWFAGAPTVTRSRRLLFRTPLVRMGILFVAVIFVSLMTRPAYAIIATRGAVGANSTTASLSFSALPSGVVAGDLMLAIISVYSASATITNYDGWAQFPTNGTATVGTMKSFMWYKIATGTDVVPTFTTGAAVKSSAIIVAYSGVDTSSIANALVGGAPAVANTKTTGSTALTTNSLSATVPANARTVAAFGFYGTGTTSPWSPVSVDSTTPAYTNTMDKIETLSSYAKNSTPMSAVESGNLSASTTMVGAQTVSLNAAAAWAGFLMVLNPGPSLTQSNYRWFDSSTTAGAVGAPLAAQNTAIALKTGTPVRLRMLVDVGTTQMTAAVAAFKLQYSYITSGTCATATVYNDVTALSPIAYYDNAAAANGFSPLVASSGNDPTDGTAPINQTYVEASPVAVQTTIPNGQSGMWDFSLILGNSANLTGSYCLRLVSSTGASLAAYGAVPTINALAGADMLAQGDSRVYQNADTITPGPPLAGTNIVAPLTSTGQSFRARVTVTASFFKQISTGGGHTCALASNDNAYCWGYNYSGQLGDNQACGTGNCLTPAAVFTGGALSSKSMKSISTASSNTCAIASDNKAYCWGDNSSGQLGDNQACGTVKCSVPVAVSVTGVLAGKTITSIALGSKHACVIASDNQAYCWGDNFLGQLGDNKVCGMKCSVPVAVSVTGVLAGKTITSIALGGQHACVVASDNQAYCWGDNSSGQLGDNQACGTVKCSVPVAVTTTGALSGKSVSRIAVGQRHTCVIASDNQAYCWGDNSSGQLGDNQACGTGKCAMPVAVSTSGVLANKTVASIALGQSHTCLTSTDGYPFCWGSNSSGQLGDGQACGAQCNAPVATFTSDVLSTKLSGLVSSNSGSTCVVASDNQAYCWGNNYNGQLGNNSTTQSPTPVAVSGVTGSTGLASRVLEIAKVNGRLQYAQKTTPTCRAQTGYAAVTASTPIAYNDNPSVANASAISSNVNDPLTTNVTPETYQDLASIFTNPSSIPAGNAGMWDFALKDNGAPANTSYCLRISGDDGSSLARYGSYAEVRTSGSGGATLDQQLRGGQSVINGVKQPMSW